MTTFTELFEQLDSDDNVRGKQFERISKWYLEHDPVYAGQLTQVWLWKDWPGRWYAKKEAGIDLVAKHRDGTLWAIQAKAYHPAYSVTKEDMNRFLSESNRKDRDTGRFLFSYRLLLATTDKLGSTARNTMNAQAIPVGHLGRTDLDAVEIDWPASPSDLRVRRLPPKEPKGQWAYQGEAMNKVVTGFRQADRGKLIMACGTGKTLVALFIREKLAAERTLVLMPSLQLMKQTIGEWRRNKKVDFDFLPVCSDETVSKDDDDMPVSSTSDLGFPVNTDPEEIATFLRRRSGPRVVFATYQSSPQIAKAFKLGRVPAFDLAIADEAHRCAAPHSSEFATILDNEKIKAHRRLFMTATPRIYSARVLRTAMEAGFEFASMDDEEKFGKVFHRLSFREAIERDLLTDYRVAIIGVDNATYRDWAEKAWFITVDGKEVKDARAVAGQIGLAKAMRRFDLRRVITFHRLRKRAKEFAASLPEVIDWMPGRERPKGKLWTAYVDGTMPADDRQRRLQSLSDVGEGERGLISNARCLTEGIDVPTLDGVAFIDPKRSEIDIAQAVGRAIRLADGKTIGTIVIPVFIATDEPNPDVILDDSAFKPVWDVLLALRSHDEELAQQLDDLRRMLGRLRRGSRGPVRLPDKIYTDIPDACGVDFVRAFYVRLVEQTTAPWEFRFGLLEKFVEREGYARVPQRHIENGVKLGSWVLEQRMNKDKMSKPRRTQLEALPGWTWSPHTDTWEQGYEALTSFAARAGHARVPRDHIEHGVKLGAWVKEQRRNRHSMSDERRQRLESVPGWSWNAVEDSWYEHLALLQAFAAREGHTRVPVNYVENGLQLGQWTRLRRGEHKKLSPERQALLEGIPGWYWGRSGDFIWDQKLAVMKKFVNREGHARVASGHIEDGVKLGAWVTEQRAERRNLSPGRVAHLEALPGWSWTVSQDIWGERYELVRKFADREGHARVPQSYVENGVYLGKWVGVQRQKRDKLTAERRARLDSVPGWSWNPHEDSWQQSFEALQRFVAREGHARVPDPHVEDGIKLGNWVVEQRMNRSTMSRERKARLEALPGWVWDARSDLWEQGYRRLKEYTKKHGHSQVPNRYEVDGYRLGQWVNTVRQRGVKGSLDPEQMKLLETLPGWTWTPKADSWERAHDLLLKYVEKHGDALVPQSYSVEGFQLGAWVAAQRRNYAKGTLKPDRERRLPKVRGWVWRLR